MYTSTELIILILLGVIIILLIILILRKKTSGSSEIQRILSNESIRTDQLIRSEFKNNREETSKQFTDSHSFTMDQMKYFGNHQNQWFQAFQKQLEEQSKLQNQRLHDIKSEVTNSLTVLQKDNHKQLEKMRETVDEKLQKTLETRLGSSFEKVSKHLEAVQRGLGEMQNLAAGVGDLKKVLSNVKTRGVMGEMMLGNILEQILTPDQYSLNVKTIPHSSAHVEFAIKFPGKEGAEVWLPIDSKFPMDLYEHLLDAYDNGTAAEIDQHQAALKKTVFRMAKDIQEKYISPPHTTEFGVLFLPIEGLYAEIVRNPGLLFELQNKYRIMVAGPSNLAAFLNSLQLGFRTIAIEKRSSEVWNILSSVKTEFGKFGKTLEKVQTKLTQASKTIDDVGVRSRAIERNLRKVEKLPSGEKQSTQDLLEDILD